MAINAVFGTIIAWVLVRDEFPGKKIVNALIDLPFALPTIVAGVVLLALYGKGSPVGIDVAFTRTAIGLALLFVTLPFVVRSVQPVLHELDVSMEEAAESLGASPLTVLRRVVLPSLTPAIISGDRAQLRARGRRVRLARADHRQPAVQDGGRLGLRVRADPERKPARRGRRLGRAAGRGAGRARGCSRCSRAGGPSMSSSDAGLARPPPRRRRDRPHRARRDPSAERAVRVRKYGVRTIALGYLALLLLAPVAMIFYRTFEHGLTPVFNAIGEPNAQHAFWLSLEIVAISVPLNTIFGIGMALLLERGRFKGKALLGLLIDLPFAISPVVIGLALVLAYGKTGWLGDWLAENGIQVIFSVPGMVIATAIVSLPFVARETIPVLRELGTDAEQAASTLGASALADVLAHHAAGHPLGRRLRRRADDRARARRVRRREHRLRAHRGRDADAAAVRAGAL